MNGLTIDVRHASYNYSSHRIPINRVICNSDSKSFIALHATFRMNYRAPSEEGKQRTCLYVETFRTTDGVAKVSVSLSSIVGRPLYMESGGRPANSIEIYIRPMFYNCRNII